MDKESIRASLTIGRRIAIVLVIVLAAFIGMLELAERSPEALRLGLQDYLTQANNGNPAEITKLEKASLFPSTEFIVNGIVVREHGNADKTLVTVERTHIMMDAWDVFLGLRRYRAVQFENMAFATDYIVPEKVDIRFAGISDSAPQTDGPQFLIEGEYGGRGVLATLALIRYGESRPEYGIPDQASFTFKLGESEARGMLTRTAKGPDFENVEISSGGQAALLDLKTQNLSPFSMTIEGTVSGQEVAGMLDQEDGKTRIALRLQEDNKAAIQDIQAFLAGITEDFGLSGEDLDIEVEMAAPDMAQQENGPNRKDNQE